MNNTYWKERYKHIEAMNNKNAKLAFKDIERSFFLAQKQLDKDIEKWLNRIARNNEVSLYEAKQLLTKNELKEFHWTVQEYIKFGKKNEMDGAWMKELENASAKFHITRLEALKTNMRQHIEVAYDNQLQGVTGVITNSYKDSYYKSIYEAQKGFNVGFDIMEIDEKQLNKLINMPWANDGKNFSDRVWSSKTYMVKTMQQELIRNCALGETLDKTIKNMSYFSQDKTSKAISAAGRLVMTEQAYFSSLGLQDSYKALDVEEYEFFAVLDIDTSKICQEMNGKVFSSKDFEVGVNAPPMHPWCRSTTVPYFNDEFTQNEKRVAKNENGEDIYVDSDISYEEWYNKYVKKSNSNEMVQVSGAISRKDYERRDKHAELYYESIRKRKSDIQAISKNTGFTVEDVTKIKNHVFYNKYNLNDEIQRFAPDFDMAVSWQRLIEGNNIQEMDIILLNHELLEEKYMNIYEMTYNEAHKLAEEKYNYIKFVKALDNKEGIFW